MSAQRPDIEDTPRAIEPPSGSVRSSFVVQSFFSADVRSVGLLRIVLGILLVVDLLPRLRHVEALYSNDGVLTNHFALFRPLAPHQFSLLLAFSSSRDVTFVLVLGLVVYVLFAVGYRTRLFQVLSFICVTSLHSRNLMAELPGDVPLHLWLAWSLFLPVGARFSVDSLRRSLAQRQEHTPADLNMPFPAAGSIVSIAVGGMILQLAAMHLGSAFRQVGESWRDGSAVYYVLHQSMWSTYVGAWFSTHVSFDTLRLFCFAYRWLEILVGCLILVPLLYARRAAIVLLLLLHLGSRALWNVGLYDWVVLGAVPLLFSPRDWETCGAWYARRKHHLTVYFDADCGVCLAICRVFCRLDLLGRLTFVSGKADDAPLPIRELASETVVVRDDAAQEIFVRSRAVAALVAALPLGSPFALLLRLPGVSWVADRAYDGFARHRTRISVFFGYDACGVPRALPELTDSPPRVGSRIPRILRECSAALFLLICVAALARGTTDLPRVTGLDGMLQTAVAYPRIFQRWGLFAPDPPDRQGTIVIDGTNAKGNRVDPFTGLEPLTSLGARAGRLPQTSPLLSAYYASISDPSRASYIDGLREYAKRLGDRREGDDKVRYFAINWVETEIPPPIGEMVPRTEGNEAVLTRKLIAYP